MLNHWVGVPRARREDRRPDAIGTGEKSVTQQTLARGTNSVLVSARGAAPEFAVRFAGALLAVAVAAVHVADQGGVMAMADPAWIGWGYRLIEVGGVLFDARTWIIAARRR